MDRAALEKLDKGLYVLTAVDGGRGVGCVVSAVTPLSSAAPQLTVRLHRANFTAGAVRRTKKFALSVLAESAPKTLIQRFGLCSCRDMDKFEGLPVAELRAMPCPAEHVNAILVCRAWDLAEAGEHLLVLARVTDAVVLRGEPCLRDRAYRLEQHGPVPPHASPLL